MCFYVYAQNTTIKLDYVSETITLNKDGSSDVEIDLLVTNKSDAPVDCLSIIYPNKFARVRHVVNDNNEKSIDTVRDGIIEDKSHIIPLTTHRENRSYRLPGSKILEEAPDDTVAYFEVPEGATPICVVQADPNNPMRSIKYYGVLHGGSELDIDMDNYDCYEWKALLWLNNSALKCKLEKPLMKNIPRWFRWHFKARRSILNVPSVFSVSYIVKKYTNLFPYNYEICGPFDVIHRLRSGLNAALMRLEEDSELSGADFNLINGKMIATKSLIEKIFGGDDTAESLSSTIITEWRTHLFPDVLERITDIVQTGYVLPSGGFPNYIHDMGKSIPCYEWKTGPKILNDNALNVHRNHEEDDTYLFKISFQAKYLRLFPVVIPWISLIIGSCALTWKIYDALK
ncbi:MAG: hypothetical protein HZC51_01545 [Nitrospirae bacterium]|nr:hypothetical protein [Nitrospirota bacterium]